MRHSSTRSFSVLVEPGPLPRLAGAVFLVHLLVAASPWIARVTPPLAAILSVVAVVGLALTLRVVPGAHCLLKGLAIDSRGCRGLLAGSRSWAAAEVGAGSRAYPLLVFIELRIEGRRLGWLLTPASLPAADFRRLKARIRLAC